MSVSLAAGFPNYNIELRSHLDFLGNYEEEIVVEDESLPIFAEAKTCSEFPENSVITPQTSPSAQLSKTTLQESFPIYAEAKTPSEIPDNVVIASQECPSAQKPQKPLCARVTKKWHSGDKECIVCNNILNGSHHLCKRHAKTWLNYCNRTELGDRIKELRNENKFTLNYAARKSGVDISTLGRVERSESRSILPTLAKIAKFYNKPLDYFF